MHACKCKCYFLASIICISDSLMVYFQFLCMFFSLLKQLGCMFRSDQSASLVARFQLVWYIGTMVNACMLQCSLFLNNNKFGIYPCINNMFVFYQKVSHIYFNVMFYFHERKRAKNNLLYVLIIKLRNGPNQKSTKMVIRG